jgi:protein-disulfide isomerase-like protein with CxxC motif
MMQPYPVEIEQQMQRYYESLSEKDRRRYAAIEAVKLGYGGISYISRLLGCHYRTITLGMDELHDEAAMNLEGIRRSGGGRKSAFETIEGLDEAFLKVLRQHTAGSPTDETIKWTHLTRQEIAELLKQEGIEVSVTVVDQLLEKHKFRKRKAMKSKATGASEHRNEQFENIAQLIEEYQAAGYPVISMDTKKKELIGNLYREGQLYTQETIEVFDHDWPSLADGVAIPHGLWDLTYNIGYIQIGTSHDTSEFACDSVDYWWNTHGKFLYANATKILILCDGGGSNNSRHYVFKQDLQMLVNELGIEIRIAHYPPYTSKYNPIEHRLFPHVTRACQGVIFESVEVVKDLMARATTKTGLHVFTTILDKTYETGRKIAEEFKETMQIVFDELLPQWNYTAVPQLP